ncbi:hypothetical protein FOB64_005224 [Candida albicans]|uniref:Uncharacterized protein n=1 Tax=Candida albicans TaxID=5476 RepID=A0A8H6BWF2_CANAX|nr:hypothetical protein FOB64_005224 [Candida albicans]
MILTKENSSYSYANDFDQTVTLCPSESTIDATNLDFILTTELPFFPLDYQDYPLMDLTTEELLQDKFPNTKFPYDGFINFHSLKFVVRMPNKCQNIYNLQWGLKK